MLATLCTKLPANTAALIIPCSAITPTLCLLCFAQLPTDAGIMKTARSTGLGNSAMITDKGLTKLILDYHTVAKPSITAGTQTTKLPGYTINVSSPK